MATPLDFTKDALIGGAVMKPGTLVSDAGAQAITNVEPIQKKANTIDSSQANSYLSGIQAQQDALKATPGATSVQNLQTGQMDTLIKPPEAPAYGSAEYLRKQAGSMDIDKSARSIYDPQAAKIETAAGREQAAMDAAKKEATATQNAAAFRYGQSGTDYATSALAKQKAEFDRQQATFDDAKAELLHKAWDTALSGAVGQSQQLMKEAQAVDTAKTSAAKAYATSQKDIIELQKADVQEGGAIYSAVQSGVTLNESQLTSLDTMRGYRPGTASILQQAERANFAREKTKTDREAFTSELNIEKSLADLADRPLERQGRLLDIQAKLQASKDAVYTTLEKIQKAVQGAMPGQVIPIGNSEYFGLSGVAQGFVEKDANGMGRIGGFDASGKWKQQSLGYIGDPNDLETVFVNGLSIVRNKRTGVESPITNGVGGAPYLNGWSEQYPDGCKGGQCGEFIHQFVEDYPYNVSTVDARRAIVNIPAGEKPRVGDVLLQDYGTTGHSAMVQKVFEGTSGTMMQLLESNFIGGETVTSTRSVSVKDPSVLGYFRGQLRPRANTGSDMPAVAGPTKPGEEFKNIPSTHAKTTPTATDNPFIAPGVPMTATQMQDAQQKYSAAKRGAETLLNKGSVSDIPIEIRTEAMNIASKQGWKPKAETSAEVWGQALLDGAPMTNVPQAERTLALEFASKQGYKPAGNAKFQKMSDGAKSEFVELFGIGSMIENLKYMKSIPGMVWSEADTGPFAAATNAVRGWFNIANPNLLDMNTETQNLKSGIMKERSGAAVGESEVKRLSQFLPIVSDNDQVFDSKLANLEKNYSIMLENKAKLYGFDNLDEFKKQFGIGSALEGFSVTAPDGQVLTFPDQASADKFKEASNLK